MHTKKQDKKTPSQISFQQEKRSVQQLQLKDNRESMASQKELMQRIQSPTVPCLQRKSDIKTQEGQSYDYGLSKVEVGKKMEAYLDPDDLLQGHSACLNSSQDKMMECIKVKWNCKSGTHLVKGHLLNDNLGGLAYNNNLYPITKNANSKHLGFVEKFAKSFIKCKHPIYYLVEVSGDPSITNPSTIFNCEIKKWQPLENKVGDSISKMSIESNLTTLGNPKPTDEKNNNNKLSKDLAKIYIEEEEDAKEETKFLNKKREPPYSITFINKHNITNEYIEKARCLSYCHFNCSEKKIKLKEPYNRVNKLSEYEKKRRDEETESQNRPKTVINIDKGVELLCDAITNNSKDKFISNIETVIINYVKEEDKKKMLFNALINNDFLNEIIDKSPNFNDIIIDFINTESNKIDSISILANTLMSKKQELPKCIKDVASSFIDQVIEIAISRTDDSELKKLHADLKNSQFKDNIKKKSAQIKNKFKEYDLNFD